MNLNTVNELRSPSIKPVVTLSTPSIPKGSDTEDMFGSIFQSAIDNINQTNGYLSTAENEEIKLALGQSDNTHDLAIALQKASTALQYTVAIRDKFLEAYKEIMNMQF